MQFKNTARKSKIHNLTFHSLETFNGVCQATTMKIQTKDELYHFKGALRGIGSLSALKAFEKGPTLKGKNLLLELTPFQKGLYIVSLVNKKFAE